MSSLRHYSSLLICISPAAICMLLQLSSGSGQVNLQFTLMGKFYLKTNSSRRVDADCTRTSCTVLFCAKMCSTYPVCASFSLNTQNGTCLLHDQPWTATSATYSDVTWKSFNRNKEAFPESCVDGKDFSPNGGVQLLLPSYLVLPFPVYCDQDTDGGGWAIFQRRNTSKYLFNRNYTEYLKGFGDLQGTFWLGLEKIHLLTGLKNVAFRADVKSLLLVSYFETYGNFTVDNYNTGYRLTVGGSISGTAGDYFSTDNNNAFSTNDNVSDCTPFRNGGWWYNDPELTRNKWVCVIGTNLNGQDSFYWGPINLAFSELKLRPTF